MEGIEPAAELMAEIYPPLAYRNASHPEGLVLGGQIQDKRLSGWREIVVDREITFRVLLQDALWPPQIQQICTTQLFWPARPLTAPLAPSPISPGPW